MVLRLGAWGGAVQTLSETVGFEQKGRRRKDMKT